MNDNIIQNTSQEEKLLDIYYEQLANANSARFTGDWRMAEAFGMFESIFLLLIIKLCKPTSNGGKIIDGERWVYNTYEGWQENFFKWRSVPAIKNSVLKLEKEGYLLSCQPDSFDRKKYYRPDQLKIMRKLAELYPSEFPTVQQSSPIDGIKNIPSMRQNLSVVNRNTLNTDTKTKLLLEADEKISENQNEIGKVFKAYEGEIGILTPMVSANIQEALEVDNIPPDWIVTAIGEASRNNKRNWAYVSAILKNWKANGFQTDKGKPQGKAKGGFKKPKYDMGDYEVSHKSEIHIVEDKDWEGFDGEVPF